jgi:predicted MFS family arabinose efflux permease
MTAPEQATTAPPLPASAADTLLIPLLSAGNFVIGMGAFMVIGMLGPIGAGLGMSAATAGWTVTFYAIGYAIASPVLVAATGAIGRRRILTAGLAIFALAALLAAIAPGPAALFAARLLAAAGAGIYTPVAAAAGAGLSPPEARGRALAAVFFGLTLAQVMGVPAGSFIAYSLGWRWAFVIVAILALPCIWGVWTRVPRGLPFQPTRMATLAEVLLTPALMLTISFTATFLGAIYVIFTYLAPLLESQMGYGRDGITLALLVMGCGAVAGGQLGGILTDRAGALRTLTALCIVQICLLPLFSALPFPDLALFGLLAVWTTCGWSFMAAQQARVIAAAPDRANVMLALNAACIYVGAALGSAFGAAVLAGFGDLALGIAAAIAMLGALAHLRLTPVPAP